ncbi:putative ubiquitin carboxyl-terminal hydrolase [Triangularia setosa]|uniref:Ubiquitin carboxyl-terminal hydrolase n=1 Tax=Triangularia setosa TaxID=2587417 RepID=A0AAN6W4X8_9PEZI|nr:putative ubiquitin carboxyl-terminal hydrolase [Podospora setosa]
MVGFVTMTDHAGSSRAGPTNGLPNGGGKGTRPLPHIEDIISVDVDLDAHAPIERVVQMAENYLRQAESSKTFGRPDLALKDYIRANIIALDLIKKNKGWVSMQRDSRTLYERYTRLLKQLDATHAEFERIKAEIKADNVKTGVQPATQKQSLYGVHTFNGNAFERANGATSGIPSHSSSSPLTPPRTKPVVGPKPQGLHGNAISKPSAKAQDLAQRFANLRTGTPKTAQDPRVRTQPIVSPAKTTAPGSPPPPFSPTSLGGAFGELPRMPDAIYNPPRGTVSKEAASLPSSTPRAMFSRTGSVSSINISKALRPSMTGEIFSTTQSFDKPTSNKRTKLSLPGFHDETITVKDLLQYQQAGSKEISILIVDIRSREEFDEGHILSQATICVEPEILARPHISANDIADSMVLAPASEQLLFERRAEFDLVVFYDQGSVTVPAMPSNSIEQAVFSFFEALSFYDFVVAKTAKSRPKLLQGGLDAWTNMVGKASLQTSSTIDPTAKPASTAMAKSFLSQSQKYTARPIQNLEEAKRWEKNISDPTSIIPIRSTEDFLRRYPPVTGQKESMISPVEPSPSSQRSESPLYDRISREHDFYSSLPSPPARPAPAVPRRSHSGLAESDEPVLAKAVGIVPGGTMHHAKKRKNRTGLFNPGVHCFANSSLQALFATALFSEEIYEGTWRDTYKAPPKRDEDIANPQLLMKCLENLFQWLNTGSFEFIEAKTFMQYVRYIHHKVNGETDNRKLFGGNAQQDAQEFYSFICANIDDETNTRRDRVLVPPLKWEYYSDDGTPVENAVKFWNRYIEGNNSLITKYFRTVDVAINRCSNCYFVRYNFEISDLRYLHIDETEKDPIDITTLLDRSCQFEKHKDLECEKCKRKGHRSRAVKYARLPDRLVLCLERNKGLDPFTFEPLPKIRNIVKFPIRGLDMRPYFAGPADEHVDPADRHFEGDMVYDCYAVTVHIGSSTKSGHYVEFVKDDLSSDPDSWWECNDQRVTAMKVGPAHATNTAKLYGSRSDSSTAFLIFYERRGTRKVDKKVAKNVAKE